MFLLLVCASEQLFLSFNLSGWFRLLMRNKIFIVYNRSCSSYLYVTLYVDQSHDHKEDIDGSQQNGSISVIIASASVIALPTSVCRSVYCWAYYSWKCYWSWPVYTLVSCIACSNGDNCTIPPSRRLTRCKYTRRWGGSSGYLLPRDN